MDLTQCGMQAIEGSSFYDMSRLQNLNLRYTNIIFLTLVSQLKLVSGQFKSTILSEHEIEIKHGNF